MTTKTDVVSFCHHYKKQKSENFLSNSQLIGKTITDECPVLLVSAAWMCVLCGECVTGLVLKVDMQKIK